MISTTSIDGKSVELYHNVIDISFNLQSDKKYWRKDLVPNLQLIKIVDSSRLFVVSKSVFDRHANAGVLNSFQFVPLIYYTDAASTYIDVSWFSSLAIS
jgi:hypothetical protein